MSTSEALAQGQTWVDTSIYGPIAVRKLGSCDEEDRIGPLDQAALNMPPYASGHALSTRFARVDQNDVPTSLPFTHVTLDGATPPPSQISHEPEADQLTAMPSIAASMVTWPGAAKQAANPATTRPLSRPPAPRLVVPQKLPPSAVLRSAAQRGTSPGNWEWDAVSRSLCNTFTMQDGGAFRNDRAKVSARDTPVDEEAEATALKRAHFVAHAAAQARAVRQSGVVLQPAAAGGSVVPSRECAVEQNASKQDHAEEQRRAAARQAAEVAQSVRARQQRWEMQSALLPLLKREALQADGTARA